MGGGATVLMTRPDLVLLKILGCATIAGAGAWNVVNTTWIKGGCSAKLTVVVVLRTLPELALGLVVALVAFLVVVFFTAVFLVAAAGFTSK